MTITALVKCSTYWAKHGLSLWTFEVFLLASAWWLKVDLYFCVHVNVSADRRSEECYGKTKVAEGQISAATHTFQMSMCCAVQHISILCGPETIWLVELPVEVDLNCKRLQTTQENKDTTRWSMSKNTTVLQKVLLCLCFHCGWKQISVSRFLLWFLHIGCGLQNVTLPPNGYINACMCIREHPCLRLQTAPLHVHLTCRLRSTTVPCLDQTLQSGSFQHFFYLLHLFLFILVVRFYHIDDCSTYWVTIEFFQAQWKLLLWKHSRNQILTWRYSTITDRYLTSCF